MCDYLKKIKICTIFFICMMWCDLLVIVLLNQNPFQIMYVYFFYFFSHLKKLEYFVIKSIPFSIHIQLHLNPFHQLKKKQLDISFKAIELEFQSIPYSIVPLSIQCICKFVKFKKKFVNIIWLICYHHYLNILWFSKENVHLQSVDFSNCSPYPLC